MSNLHLWHRTELGKLKQDMEELFDSFVRDFCNPMDLRLLRREPDVRVLNEKDAVIVSAHVPGLDPQSIKVSITGHQLSLAGEKIEEVRDGRGLSISHQGFSSSVRLPAPVQTDQVRASYSGGVLRVVLPKCKDCTPVQVSTEEHERGRNE
ncbi:HSP20 family protein [Desulfomicrobium apsheronum]|uniref:HSP20 family protein n=1 Tax=Desulfomicrobium apsheronum TaxID=52560 RepID=A0A1I3NSG3_9BACT|nr:Hsp20/alpha crystallin family protein [Desulfomicrobium apsheronum]SFJ12067.1 HSP20 family protein [Desulfomicrobium apsheronum]